MENTGSESLKSSNPPEWHQEPNPRNDRNQKPSQLMLSNPAGNEADKTIEVLTQIKNEYSASSQPVLNILQKLHISPKRFLVNTRKHLEDISHYDGITNFGQHTIINKILDDSQTALEAAKLARQEAAIRKRIRTVSKSHSNIEEEIAGFNKELILAKEECHALLKETQKETHHAQLLSSKTVNYNHLLNELKKEMIEKKVTDLKAYNIILENYEKLKAMNAEITALQEDLQKYAQLPPDLGKASEILRQARHEEGQLMDQITSKMNTGAKKLLQ